jgi:hypothetical protein
MAEQDNHRIADARPMPVTDCVKEIVSLESKQFYDGYQVVAAMRSQREGSKLTPFAVAYQRENFLVGGRLNVRILFNNEDGTHIRGEVQNKPNGTSVYEVEIILQQDGPHIVRCKCMYTNATGFPCWHACGLILTAPKPEAVAYLWDVESPAWVSSVFHAATLALQYKTPPVAVTTAFLGSSPLEPPSIPTQGGRRKKKRRKNITEKTKTTAAKAAAAYKQRAANGSSSMQPVQPPRGYHCQRCGKANDHYSNNCKQTSTAYILQSRATGISKAVMKLARED